MTRRADTPAEDGFTLIEVMITLVVITAALLITLSVFTEMGRATYVAQRKAVLVSMAQREMERLRVLDYDQLGLSQAMPAGAPGRCREACPGEPLVSGGIVEPGPKPFDVQGVTGTIYRYVTWRPQACPVLSARVAGELGGKWGHTAADISAAVGDLCPGAQQTKRITIVVTAKEIQQFYGGPVRLSTVATDPDSSVLAAGNYDGLQVDSRQIVEPTEPPPSATYGAMTSQTFNLTDTECSRPARRAPGTGHPSHDTSADRDPAAPGAQAPACADASGPDLMTPEAITGAIDDPLPDLSQEVTRGSVGGRALARDDRAGSCEQELAYAPDDAERRRRSVHTWATPAPTAGWQTPTSAGRATLTFWTQTASAKEAPGRLCATVWRAGTGEVLATTDYRLPAWPGTPTQLAISFDLAHTIAPAGERLVVTLRTPEDSGDDLLLLYDHAGYQSALSVTTRQGSPMRFGAGADG